MGRCSDMAMEAYEVACEEYRHHDITLDQFRHKLRRLGYSVREVNSAVYEVEWQQCRDAGRV